MPNDIQTPQPRSVVVIPDVHGRDFWKNAVDSANPKEEIVFLGDYLEPYTRLEGISSDQAYGNFLEILDFAKANQGRCRLLIGNHDLACMYRTMVSCRHDYVNEERNAAAFFDNLHLFKLAHSCETEAGRQVVFSHAGILRGWFESTKFANFAYKEWKVPDMLNEKFRRDPEGCLDDLRRCTWLRGGDDYEGSCVWADVEEWVQPEEDAYVFFQVFGHSLCRKPICTERFAMLDCRAAFRIPLSSQDIVPVKIP